MTSADVAAITAELTSGKTTLIDAKIEKIYQPAEDEVRINLYVRGRGRENLIIESGKRLHMSKYLKESPKTAQGFPMLLRKHIMGGRIIFIEQHEFDRIVKIGIVRGGEETVLIAELFSKGNVILTDKEGKIILPLKPVTFKERRIRSGEIYELPGKQLNPMKTTAEEMKEVFAASDRDTVRTMAAQFNLGGLYSEEIFYRCAVDKTKPANELTDTEIQTIFEAVNEIMEPIKRAQFNPRLVLKEKKQKAGAEAEPAASVELTASVEPAATVEPAASADSAASAEPEAQSPEKPAFVLPKGMEIADVVALDLVQYKDLPFAGFETFSESVDEAIGKTALSAVQTKKEEIKQDKKLGIYERRLKQQVDTIEKFDREIEKNTKIAETI
ncbi:MAG: NFACT family protein, partial [Methanimicrococcus sp.]|nr:NFACT family protein [Methanimicrococcus sp.]